MNKTILKKIAKDYAKGILFFSSMDCDLAYQVMTDEEREYVQEELMRICERITPSKAESTLDDIIKKYYVID